MSEQPIDTLSQQIGPTRLHNKPLNALINQVRSCSVGRTQQWQPGSPCECRSLQGSLVCRHPSQEEKEITLVLCNLITRHVHRDGDDRGSFGSIGVLPLRL